MDDKKFREAVEFRKEKITERVKNDPDLKEKVGKIVEKLETEYEGELLLAPSEWVMYDEPTFTFDYLNLYQELLTEDIIRKYPRIRHELIMIAAKNHYDQDKGWVLCGAFVHVPVSDSIRETKRKIDNKEVKVEHYAFENERWCVEKLYKLLFKE